MPRKKTKPNANHKISFTIPDPIAERGSSSVIIQQKEVDDLKILKQIAQESAANYHKKKEQHAQKIAKGATINVRDVKYTLVERHCPSYKDALIEAKGEDYQQDVMKKSRTIQYWRIRYS